MKKLLLLLLLTITISAKADSIILPFDYFPKELEARFQEHGKKLDLDIKDRCKDSWAYLSYNTGQWTICTYKPVTEEELDLIMLIVNGTVPYKES